MIPTLIAAAIVAAPPSTADLAKYIAKRNPRVSQEAPAIAAALIDASRAHNVPLRVLVAVSWIESRFRPRVRGRYQEVGLTQVRYVDLGLSTPWAALRRAGRISKALDRPWRKLSMIARARALENVYTNAYLGAWAIRNAVRVCYRLGHRGAVAQLPFNLQ